ncbi:phosphotransferase enzyme family protein [Brevibacterium permense]|uniref:phosphotransferase enzyme family protein n=1 Tax=Brevibacterium permense TaxID=234834 RepID=UPI0021CFDD2E|nr:phosphotransferase [Brevibacterium permense]
MKSMGEHHQESESAAVRAAEELVRTALPEFGLPSGIELKLLKRRENSVFALNHESSDYVVRVHRQGYHSDEELGREIGFVRALAGRGVRVPQFIPASGDRSFVRVGHDHPSGEHQIDLQHYIPNLGNFGDENTAFDGTAALAREDFHELGELIAQAHLATVDSGFSVSESHPSWDADGLIGTDALWGFPLRVVELNDADRSADRRTLEAAISVIRDRLGNYGHRADRYGPIHADLTPENVLRTENGLVLIDFDDFAAGWHLFDLATALYFFTHHPRRDEYQAALFSGYQRHRRLDAEDFAVFPAILVARGLTYLGWAADRRGEPAAEFHVHDVLPHLVGLASALVESSEPEGVTL